MVEGLGENEGTGEPQVNKSSRSSRTPPLLCFDLSYFRIEMQFQSEPFLNLLGSIALKHDNQSQCFTSPPSFWPFMLFGVCKDERNWDSPWWPGSSLCGH